MTAAVEDRIVAMKMENTQFEKAAAQSIATFQKLESTLNKGISAKGLDDIHNSVGRFNMNPMEAALSGISKSWLAMSTIAVTALAQVTSSVITTGTQMVKSLTLDPILSGFGEYSTNLQSIQTVLANTEAQGTTLDDVNAALQNLNNYSDKTIYNFGEMAKNIGTFTAAGVDLQGSVDSIKGIANLAALSGSSSQQASTAMYQLSQAIAAGRVSLQDWNSVVNAGMGGATFQRALTQTAIAMGTIDESAVNIEKSTGKMTINGASFRDSISAIGGEKWLTSDVLTNTLSQFTGDLTDAQLAAQGFNKEQIKAIQQTAKTAQDAATKVKTIQQVFDVAKETVGSGWSLTFQRIFGDFEQARTTMTSLSNFINGIITQNSNARNKILKQWGDMGGRTKIISAVTNAWKALMSVLGPIHDAFREIFPKATAEQLFQLSKSLNQFFRHLRVTKDAQEDLKNTFAGFFAVIHIGYSIVKGIVSVLATLIGLFVRGQGGTLAFTGGIGQMLVALDKFLTGGERMQKVFDAISAALTAILGPLFEVRNGLIEAFMGLVTLDPTRFFAGLSDAIEHVLGLVDSLSDKFADVVNTISDAMGGLGHISGFNLASMFGGFGGAGAPDPSGTIDKIRAGVEGIEGPSLRISLLWDKIVSAFQRVGDFFAPLIDQFKRAGSALSGAFSDLFSGAASSLDFTDFLNAVNTGLFLALFLTFRRFSKAITDVSKAASGVLNQVTSNLKTMQADVRADMILKIAGALALLAAAVFLLAQTDPQSLGLALGAVVTMLTALVIAMKVLEKQVNKFSGGAKLVAVATGMVIMAVALAAMAAAVYLFGKMDFKTLEQGLLGALQAMALMTAAAVAMSKGGAGANMIGAATGLLIMSVALTALAGAVLLYARLDTNTLTEGLLKIGGALLVLGVGMRLMQGTLGGAAAMAIVAGSLIILAGALRLFANFSLGEMIKGLITMGGAMLILVVGLNAMSGTIPGALAMLVAAQSMKVLAEAMKMMGDLSWGDVGKGLLILVGAIALFAAVGAVIAPVVPVMLGLAGALALIGAAVFLAGSGVAAFAAGLAILSQNGTTGFAVFKRIVEDFVTWLPEVILAFGDTIEAIAKVLGDKAPQINDAFAKLMEGLIDNAIKLTPKVGKLFSKLIETGLKVIVNYYDDLARAGLQLVENLLDAFTDALPDIADKAGDLIAAFIKAVGKQAVKLANAAADALVDFLNGLADAIESHSTQLNNAGGRIAVAVIKGITEPLRNAGQQVLDAIGSAVSWAKDHFKMPKIKIGNPFTKGRGNVDPAQQLVNQLGLVGGVDQVRTAFDAIKSQIESEIDKTKSKMDKAKSKLDALKDKGKGDSKEADKLRKEIKDQEKALKDLNAEQDNWQKKQKGHRDTLLQNAAAWDYNASQIEYWTNKVKEAEDARNSFQTGIVQQFGSAPDITKNMSLANYMRQIAQKTQETQKFMETLQKLREQNLSDESYRQLLAEGTDAQRLMEQLLAGGSEAIGKFNQANSTLKSTATTLASTASVSLFYDAAVQQAQGMLKGWQDSQGALEAQMNSVALAMVRAIKKALKMKSPSRVMAGVGEFSSEGVAMGLEAGIGAVEKSSEKVANASLETLQATMNKGIDIGVLDMNPTITPVLDLAQLARDANQIGTMLTAKPIPADVSLSKAAEISAQRDAIEAAWNAVLNEVVVKEIKLEQNNYSPESLDDTTIYRSTKNLISLAKEEL